MHWLPCSFFFFFFPFLRLPVVLFYIMFYDSRVLHVSGMPDRYEFESIQQYSYCESFSLCGVNGSMKIVNMGF